MDIGLFPFLGIINNAAMNSPVQVSVKTYVFISVLYIAGSLATPFNTLRDCQAFSEQLGHFTFPSTMRAISISGFSTSSPLFVTVRPLSLRHPSGKMSTHILCPF